MLTLMRWLARRSLATLHALGTLLGWLAYALSPTYRRRLQAHAALAGVGPAQRRQAVAEAGRMVAELPWMWLRPAERPLAGLIRWQGDEHIEAALQAGRGLVILTPHLGCFEVAAQAFVERWGSRMKLTVMYRPARQAWLRTLQETSRRRPGLETAPASLAGVRQMIRALRRGESVGLLPDQVPPKGMGVWAPFFGRPAYTMTLAARLAQQTGASLLVVWAERLPRGAGYVFHAGTLAEPLPTEASLLEARRAAGDAEPRLSETELQQACAAAINRAMEQLIRQSPGQYLWAYNRYKAPRSPEAAPREEAAA